MQFVTLMLKFSFCKLHSAQENLLGLLVFYGHCYSACVSLSKVSCDYITTKLLFVIRTTGVFEISIEVYKKAQQS